MACRISVSQPGIEPGPGCCGMERNQAERGGFWAEERAYGIGKELGGRRNWKRKPGWLESREGAGEKSVERRVGLSLS